MSNTIQKDKKSFFFSGPLQGTESVYAAIRIIVGLLMAYHGLEIFDAKLMNDYSMWDQFKGVPSPLVIVYIGKALELVTGMFFVLGIFTRISAVLITINMLVICFFIGNGKFWYEDQHPFLFALISLLFFFKGSGKWAIDNKLGK